MYVPGELNKDSVRKLEENQQSTKEYLSLLEQ